MKFNDLNKNTIVLICARGGSKGIKNKNLLKIKKNSLISISISKVKKLKFKYICLSTDDEKIAYEAKKFGINWFYRRSNKLSGPNVSKLDVWKDSIKKSEKHFNKTFKFMLDIDVSNPLTDDKDLKKFISKFEKIYKNFDGLFCCSKSWKNPYFNILEKKNGRFVSSNKQSKQINSRQKAPITYDHIAAFYYLNTKYILKTNYLFTGKLEKFHLPFHKSIDIDDKDDYEMVKKLAR